jgi:DNA-binding transcriptional regulator YiaG
MQGKELRIIRRQLKLTQAQFADLIGVKSNTVARWERNVLPISKTIALLAQLLSEAEKAQKNKGSEYGMHKKKTR